MTAVTAEQQPFPVAAWDAYSADQLHGRACIADGCEATTDLTRAGWAYTEGIEPGSRLGWPVRACPTHTLQESQ